MYCKNCKSENIISVIPLSDIAKDRFNNIMNKFHGCTILKRTNKLYLLESLNKKYYFWLQKDGNEHWKIVND